MQPRETIYGENGPVEPNSGIDPDKPFVPIESYSVGQWHPTPDGSGRPQAVQLNMQGLFVMPGERAAAMEATMYLRLKSAVAVDELCRALIRSRKAVWPNEPVNVY